MVWCEVSATVPVPWVEPVADVLRAEAPEGVAIEEPVVPLGPEEGVRVDRRRPAVVRAYLPVDDGLGERLARIAAALHAAGLPAHLHTRTVRAEEWADAWKAHFHVERVGRRLVIRPSWRAYTPAPGEVVIDLDPGMAFGTGQHPTTRACLELLEAHVRPGARVLDVGTGSGILAVAAVGLGAGHCLALDIDPRAVQAAGENAARNGVADRVRVVQGSLGAGWTLDVPPPDGADLVLANIHAAAVAALAPAFAHALAPGGRLIASGVVADRLRGVLTALRGAGLTVERVRADGEWRTVLARASGAPPAPGRRRDR
jgi:ribosomal protein L11 methyltransferase